MGILSAVLYPVTLETVTLVAEKTKGCVYLVIYKAHHIEIHHLQSQSLLEVSPRPLNEVRILGAEGRLAPRERIMKVQT